MNLEYEQIIFMGAIFAIVAVMAWWVVRLLAGSSGGRLRQRLRDTGPTGGPATSARPQAASGLGDVLNKLGQAAAKPFEPKTREKQSDLRKRMAKAGIYGTSAARLMTGCKVLLLGGGLLGGYALGAILDNAVTGMSLGGIVGYLLPALWLKTRIKRQQVALDRALPDAVDLMVVCVEAGLTVDSAMQRVGQEIAVAHPALAREFEIAHMETRVGLARADALKNLGTRTANPAITALTMMLIQAERFGTSIADALRIHAEGLRIARQNAAEEMAAKATVKLSFPVVLFIFPAVLIVLAGPAAIGLMKSALFNN